MFNNGGTGSMPATPAKTFQQPTMMEGLPPHHPLLQRKTTGTTAGQDSKYVIQHRGPMGNCAQQNTAAAFFARTTHKSSPVHTMGGQASEDDERVRTNLSHVSDFAAVLGKCPPPITPVLLKKLEANEVMGMGKVRVILRVANSGVIDEKKGSFFKMDKKKRQVTLFDPSQVRNSVAEEGEATSGPLVPAAPKMFAFDGLFTDEDPQIEICASALVDPIHAVVHGTDAALFSFGHVHLGKTYSMIGSDESSRTLGIIPTAIAWLYRAVKEKKEKTNTRFSIRVSALEIGGPREEVRDLLLCAQMAEQQNGERNSEGPPPSAYLPHSASSAHALLPNQAELRCPTAEKAGDLLDAALTARSTNMADDLQVRDSHFVFTLHVYQYSVDGAKNSAVGGVIGGRSRLHLVDFGNCDRTKTSGGAITLSGLGNVILSIFNGQRHLPCKESKVTHLLKECLGSLSCQATMIAHVSPEASHYSETLHTTQLASRIHRMRRKKAAKGSGGSAGGSGGSGSSDENRHKFIRLPGHANSSSDFTTSTDPSSSEQSCDTVIYIGSRDDDGTDAEHPPVFLPSLNSGDNRGQMAKVLRGSTAEMPKYKSSTLDRKKSKDSPVHSPTSGVIKTVPLQPQFPSAPMRQRPGSVGSTPTHNFKINPTRNPHLRGFLESGAAARGGSLPRNPKGKMPLTGKVAGYRQPPSSPHLENRLDKVQQQQQQFLLQQQLFQQHQQFQQQQQQFQQHPRSPSWGPQQIAASNFIQTQFPNGCSMETAESIYAYGYMDDHKKLMIQQWVECQTAQMNSPAAHRPPAQRGSRRPSSSSSSSSHHCHHHGPEPEPFAWLNEPQEVNGDVKCLTQFKTVDSSDDSAKEEQDEDKMIVAVDVHAKPQQGQYHKSHSTSDVTEKLGFIKPVEKSKPSPINGPNSNNKATTSSEDWSHPQSLDELYNHCEKLVETLNREESYSASSQPKSSHKFDTSNEREEILSVTVQQGGGEYLPDINEIEIVTFSEDEDQPVALTDTSCQVNLDGETVKSSDENLASTVAALDGKSLHYVKEETKPAHGPKTSTSAYDIDKNFGSVCDDAVSLGGGEDYFSKKLDQLAKLHELYQSVSSISAKCQSHLDAANKRQQQQSDMQRGKGSCFSLSALANEGHSLKSEASSSEVNSLCSEPARMFDYSDFVDINRNSAAPSVADLFMFGNGSKFCMSLGDLGDLGQFGVQPLTNATTTTTTTSDRCDSPVLEGIDGELAKYAKLKDLKHAYEPATQQQPAVIKAVQQQQQQQPVEDERRHPDGSSDPDLNRRQHPLTDLKEPVRPPDPPPGSRRSPGNGRSGSEPEEYDRPRKLGESLRPVFPVACPSSSPSCSSSLSSGNGNVVHHRRGMNGKLNANNERRTVVGKSQSTDASSDAEIWEKPCINNNDNKSASTANTQPTMCDATSSNEREHVIRKAPKFSRLFKISRSPLQIVDEKYKKRSKSADGNKDNNNKNRVNNKADKKAEKKSNKSTSNVNQSKNVQGTSFSESSHLKNKKSEKVLLPSPYAFPTAPVLPKKTSSSTSSRGSDSGHESGDRSNEKPRRFGGRSSFIKSCTFVKLRAQGGRGATKNAASTTATTTTTATLTINKKKGSAADVRATHCKSSGYESGGGPGFDSERESVNSLKGVLECDDGKPKLTMLTATKFPPVNLVDYDEEFVMRLDGRNRFCEVRRLQKEQEGLKVELRSAKNRINADPKRWSFDLHVADNLSVVDMSTDPTFLEALGHETKVLNKRVAACKSHAVLSTCFDFCPALKGDQQLSTPDTSGLISGPNRRPLSPLSQKLFDNCCTTDCDCLIVPTSQETEIF